VGLGWYGMTLNTGSSLIDHSEIRYASTAITVSGASPSVTESTFRRNYTAITISSGASPQVTDNELDDNGGSSNPGINVTAGSSPEIARNRL
jgi:Right handed beta helix region